MLVVLNRTDSAERRSLTWLNIDRNNVEVKLSLWRLGLWYTDTLGLAQRCANIPMQFPLTLIASTKCSRIASLVRLPFIHNLYLDFPHQGTRMHPVCASSQHFSNHTHLHRQLRLINAYQRYAPWARAARGNLDEARLKARRLDVRGWWGFHSSLVASSHQ